MDSRMKKRRNKNKIMYSDGSITWKGFTAFQMILCRLNLLMPIIRSRPIIRENRIEANKIVIKNIFNRVTLKSTLSIVFCS
jgi:hypothetical protein